MTAGVGRVSRPDSDFTRDTAVAHETSPLDKGGFRGVSVSADGTSPNPSLVRSGGVGRVSRPDGHTDVADVSPVGTTDSSPGRKPGVRVANSDPGSPEGRHTAHVANNVSPPKDITGGSTTHPTRSATAVAHDAIKDIDSTSTPLKRWGTHATDIDPTSDMPAIACGELGHGTQTATRRPFVKRGEGGRLTKEQPQALRVTLTQLPSPYDVFNGEHMWVGEPREVCENSGQSVPPLDGCGGVPGQIPRSIWVATLQCEPRYVDWSQFDTIHIYHEVIVPGGTYALQLINTGCSTATETNYSDALPLVTSSWADLVEDCTTFPCGMPDGSTGIVDVTAVLDKWKNLARSVWKVRADLEGAPSGDARVPDQAINITDIVFTLGAFVGQTYPPPGFPPPSDPPLCGP